MDIAWSEVREGVAVWAAPSSLEDRDAFARWWQDVEKTYGEFPASTRARLFDLTEQQLLPRRAAKGWNRFVVVLELADVDDVAPVVTKMQDAAGLDASVPAVSAFSVFRLVYRTSTPPELPPGVALPQMDVPPGPPGIFMAWTGPVSDEADADYNAWYNFRHMPETLLMEGWKRGRRFRRLPALTSGLAIPAVPAPYLSIYDIDNIGAIPFYQEVLPLLVTVGVDQVGPDAYDYDSVQAFTFEELPSLASA